MKAIKTSIASSGISLILKAILVGLLLSGATIGILLSICSVLFLIAKTLPYDILPYIMIAVCSIGTFVGGYVTSRITKTQGLIWGGSVGLLIFVSLLIAGLCSNTDTIGLVTLIKLFALTLSGGVGGIMAVNKKDKIRIK